MQTPLGLSTLVLFLTLFIQEIRINNKQIRRSQRKVYLSYVIIFFSLFLFNASVHQTRLSTFGQSDIVQFLGEHEAGIHMNGKGYHLIWTKRSFLSTVYFYNLYERRVLFFYRVNSKVIYYTIHPSREVDHGAVKTFLYYTKKEGKIVD